MSGGRWRRAAGSAVAMSAAAGLGHLLLVGVVLVAQGHPVPGPAPAAGLVLLGAVPVHLLSRHRLRLPAALLVIGTAAAVVAELVTPGPWVTALGTDTLTVGTPVLRSYAEASPLWLAAIGLAGLGEVVLRRGTRRDDRTSRLRTAGAAVLVAGGLLVAVALAGVSRGWLGSPPPSLSYGAPVLGLLGFGAAFLLLRSRLVAPWLVLTAVTATVAVAFWLQDPRFTDAASGLVAGATVTLSLALMLGLVEAVARGIVRLARRVRRR